MQPLQNDSFIQALKRLPAKKTPVWIMRQAGRYLPEYKVTRSKARSFMEFCKNPNLACEVTLQPLARYDLDAAIVFSDILTLADAWPLGLEFKESEGPVLSSPLRSEKDIAFLPNIQVEEELGYVAEAIQLIQKHLNRRVPLIGFAGSPWTQAVYMVEGKSSKTFNIIKKMLYANSPLLHVLLEKVASLTLNYLLMQIRAGADVVMLFDTWGGVLSTPAYQQFSLKYMEKIVKSLKQETPHIPIILFTKGGALWLENMVDTGCDALGIDWTIEMAEAKKRVGHRVALQGNLDPCALYGDEKNIRENVHQILSAYKDTPGLIFNLGHGIYPDIDPEKVSFLIQTVREMECL